MIRKTFVILPGIGKKKEQELWRNGTCDWQVFLKNSTIKGISALRKREYDELLRKWHNALIHEDMKVFATAWPVRESWRLYDHFKDECGFLDVEVDSWWRIVVVGISNYYESKALVLGVNLDRSDLEKELIQYKLLVTFNGASFDLPKLYEQFGLTLRVPHFDLKGVAKRVGLVGGLKEIELKLDLKRPEHLYGNPVDLWKAYKASGDREYLELLLDYNREDVENLKAICRYCVRVLMKEGEVRGSIRKI